MAPAAPTFVSGSDAGQSPCEPVTVASGAADPKPQHDSLSTTTTRQRNAQPLALPPFAEPFRQQLAAWWRLRKRKHPKADQAGLSVRSINALTLAHERGILAAFCDLAAEKGWESLGFSGYRKAIDQLAADEAFTPGVTPLHQARRTRQEEAFDNVIEFLKVHDPEFA